MLICVDLASTIECFFLALGWGFIMFGQPGLACLRAFRVIRFLFYVDYYEEEAVDPYMTDEEIAAKERKESKERISVHHAAGLALMYVKRLVAEVVTASSKGGVVVLCLFFFLTYIVATVCLAEEQYLPTRDYYGRYDW